MPHLERGNLGLVLPQGVLAFDADNVRSAEALQSLLADAPMQTTGRASGNTKGETNMSNPYGIDSPRARELIAAARALQPSLRERAAEAEEIRRVPDATIADFQEAGFFKTRTGDPRP